MHTLLDKVPIEMSILPTSRAWFQIMGRKETSQMVSL
uniref:Uncharacterized protein n=1 Tax=Picea sitchensis TaxID=3332 RepID=A9NWU2_PICSI|nr:unknown [Picea sitchensis]